MRFHMLQNVQTSLDYLRYRKVNHTSSTLVTSHSHPPHPPHSHFPPSSAFAYSFALASDSCSVRRFHSQLPAVWLIESFVRDLCYESLFAATIVFHRFDWLINRAVICAGHRERLPICILVACRGFICILSASSRRFRRWSPSHKWLFVWLLILGPVKLPDVSDRLALPVPAGHVIQTLASLRAPLSINEIAVLVKHNVMIARPRRTNHQFPRSNNSHKTGLIRANYGRLQVVF